MQDVLDMLGISRVSDSEIFTPIKVVKEMVDLLPEEVSDTLIDIYAVCQIKAQTIKK